MWTKLRTVLRNRSRRPAYAPNDANTHRKNSVDTQVIPSHIPMGIPVNVPVKTCTNIPLGIPIIMNTTNTAIMYQDVQDGAKSSVDDFVTPTKDYICVNYKSDESVEFVSVSNDETN